MEYDALRIESLERQLRWMLVGLAAVVLLAAAGIVWPPPSEAHAQTAADGPIGVPGGGSMEMVDGDPVITLPSSSSSIVLQTKGGEQIARLGRLRPQQIRDQSVNPHESADAEFGV